MEDFDEDYYENINELEKFNDLGDFFDKQETFSGNENIDKLVGAYKHSVFEELNSYDDYEKPCNEKNYVTSCYYDDIGKFDFLSKGETKNLLLKYRKFGDKNPEGLKARNAIVNSNLRFVYDIAKPIFVGFKREYSGVNVELNDIIQAGNIGLIKSLQKYKPRDIKSFIYHAKYAIKNSIYRYLKYDIRFFGSGNGHPIGLPKQIREFIDNYYRENLVDPTDYEIQDFIKDYKMDASDSFSDDYGYYYKYYLKLGNISLDKLAEQGQQLGVENETSLSNRVFMIDNEDKNNSYDDNLLDDNGEVTLKDTLLDPLVSDADRWAFLDSLKYELKTAFIILTDDEKFVLKLYFGLDGTKPFSLDEIANTMGKTPERVRQLKNRALKILRGFDKDVLEESYHILKNSKVRFNTRNDILEEYLGD